MEDAKDVRLIIKECRSYDFDLRALKNEEHGHFLEGRAIVFENPYDNGWFTEYIDEGALDQTDLKDVRLLVNHDTDMIPLARSRNNTSKSTMQLSPDEKGMTIRADLDVERNVTAQSLYSAADRGDISGMSFMFTVDRDEWSDLDTDHPVRHIKSIRKIFEVSAVTWPAYEKTSLEARSRAETLESAKATLESVKAAKAAEDRQARIAELEAKLKSIREG